MQDSTIATFLQRNDSNSSSSSPQISPDSKDQHQNPMIRSKSKLLYKEDQVINGYRLEMPISQTEQFVIFRCDKSGQKFAMKVFSRKYSSGIAPQSGQTQPSQSQNAPTQSEIEAQQEKLLALYSELKQLEHPHIVRVYDAFVYKERVCVVMHYCPGGDLRQYLCAKPSKRLLEAEALAVFRPVFSAVHEMHRHQLLHRNICPENIVFDEEGRPMLCGLDYSHEVDEDAQMLFSRCTEIEFAAPEMLSFAAIYNYKVDVWSLGALLWYMIFGQPPFGTHVNSKEQLKCINKFCRNDLFYYDEAVQELDLEFYSAYPEEDNGDSGDNSSKRNQQQQRLQNKSQKTNSNDNSASNKKNNKNQLKQQDNFKDEVQDYQEEQKEQQLPKISQDTYKIFQTIFQINPDRRIDFLALSKMKALQLPRQIGTGQQQQQQGKLGQQTDATSQKDQKNVQNQQQQQEKGDNDDTPLAIYTKQFRQLKPLNTVLLIGDNMQQPDQRITVEKKHCLLASTILSEQIQAYYNMCETKKHESFTKDIEHVLFNMARYHILLDNYQYFNISYELQIVMGGDSKVVLLKYFVLRLVLYIIYRLHYVLTHKINVFEINKKTFEEFSESEIYAILTKQVLEDKQKWDAEYIKLYQKCKQILIAEKQHFPEEILQGVQREIVIDYKADYFTLPDVFKLPSRAVFLTIFGKIYNKANRYLKYEEASPSALKEGEIRKYQEKEGKKHKRLALRLLLCAAIFRIFNPKNQKFYLKSFNQDNNFFLSAFIQWQHDIDAKNAEEEIVNIFLQFFKNLDLRNTNTFTYF